MALLCLAAGCRHNPAPPAGNGATSTGAVSPAAIAATPSVPLNTVIPAPPEHTGTEQAAALPLNLSREELTERTLDSLRKRVMGRRVSYRETKRVVDEVGPIVADAVRQSQVQNGLAMLARDEGVSVDEARRRWAAWQEADLLLESGGDPDAISGSNAEGVAQWLAGTAQGAGLRVNLRASRRLTGLITVLRWEIAWATYLARPDADRTLPGQPPIVPPLSDLPRLQATLATLREKRRKADARFDPRQAIFAQTRYLLRLYSRFPSPDWLFQAYHGGEGGAKRTLRLFLGPAWHDDTAQAIRTGNEGGKLRFEDLYRATMPRRHSQAFAYLYGRSDDHRHYWWKLRASAEAIAQCRRDPAAFEKRWREYAPGRTTDGWWYPQGATLSLADWAALQSAHAQKTLVAVPPAPNWMVRPLPDVPLEAAPYYAALRPEALGALRLVAETCRRAGEPTPLPLGDLTTTQATDAQRTILHPPKPPKGRIWPPPTDADIPNVPGLPADFDFHTTGLAFDVLRPTNPQARKTLEYALDYWQNRGVIAWTDAKDRDERRCHIIPNPRYAAVLTQIAGSGVVPALKDL